MDPGASLWAVPNPISLARLGTGHLPSVSSKPKQASRPRGRRRKTFNIKMNKDEIHSAYGGLDSTSNLEHISTSLPPGWLNAPHHHFPQHHLSSLVSSSSKSVSVIRGLQKKRGNIEKPTSVPPHSSPQQAEHQHQQQHHLLISTPHSTT